MKYIYSVHEFCSLTLSFQCAWSLGTTDTQPIVMSSTFVMRMGYETDTGVLRSWSSMFTKAIANRPTRSLNVFTTTLKSKLHNKGKKVTHSLKVTYILSLWTWVTMQNSCYVLASDRRKICVTRYALFPKGFRCPEKSGFFRDSQQCYKFYECVDGLYHELNCPVGSVFNADRGFCDHPRNVPSCRTVQKRRKFKLKK